MGGAQGAALPAVEIEHADDLVADLLFGALDVPHQAQRRAQDVADAEGDSAGMQLREIAVEQVLDNGLLPGGEDGFRDLAAGLERPARQRDLAARPGELELELLLAVRHHDEAALGAGHLDGRVEHHRQHLVEHPARAEGAQVFEQRRHLPQLARRRHRALLHRRRLVVDEEDDLGVPGLPEPNLIAVRQHPFAMLFTVDEGAEPRLLVADDADAVLEADLGVDARDVGPRQPQVGFGPASDGEQRLVDIDDAAPERVGDDKAGGRDDVGHRARNYKP